MCVSNYYIWFCSTVLWLNSKLTLKFIIFLHRLLISSNVLLSYQSKHFLMQIGKLAKSAESRHCKLLLQILLYWETPPFQCHIKLRTKNFYCCVTWNCLARIVLLQPQYESATFHWYSFGSQLNFSLTFISVVLMFLLSIAVAMNQGCADFGCNGHV